MENEPQKQQVVVDKQPSTKIFVWPSIILTIILLLQLDLSLIFRSKTELAATSTQYFTYHHMLTPLPNGKEVMVVIIGDKRDMNDRQSNIVLSTISKSINGIDPNDWNVEHRIVEDPNGWFRYIIVR